MSTGWSSSANVDLTVTNVGGIDHTSVTLKPGVNVLEGRNATNRTSLLQAIMAALGSDRSTLKGDADEGSVDLTVDGENATRTLHRRNGQVIYEGEPYLDDPTLADLFAFLLESNEARRAVERGADLRELIMRPIDTAEINARIRSLEEDKRDLDERLSELDRLESKLPELEERRTSLAETIDAREAELADLEDQLESFDADVSESQSKRSEIEDAFERLRAARRELEDLEFDLETERETKTELEAERERLRAELEDLDESHAESADELAGRISELRERKRVLDSTVSELQSVIRFNEDRLEEGGIGIDGDLGDGPAANGDGDGALTDQLMSDEARVTCWTCGSAVERDRIEETLERLRSLHREKLDERNEISDRIDDLTSQQKSIREHEQRREDLTDRIADIDAELAAVEERVADLEDAREEQTDLIADLEAETEDFDAADTAYEEVLETHREVSQVELELERHRDDLADVEERIAEIESRLDERSDLETRRESISEELTDLRTRVDRIEADAVEEFNDHMESILSMLQYANIDRIWIERTEAEVREGRKTVSKRSFDLHVVRTTDEGTTYEDTVEHLSESEREVTGLVFALAGYLVHEVYEEVPFMLLDSLEAIDSNRIADLVEYFADYAECLVVALLPGDAQALPDDYEYLTEI